METCFFFETWWKHVPTERRIMGRNELHGIDPVHNQPNIIFYCLELILFKNDQKIGMSAPPRLTGSRPGTVQAQEPFLSNQTRPETGSTIHATPISCRFLHPPLLYKKDWTAAAPDTHDQAVSSLAWAVTYSYVNKEQKKKEAPRRRGEARAQEESRGW